MNDPRIAAFNADAEKAIAHLKSNFSKLQTGRAHAGLVEHIIVDAYGQKQELRAVAGVTVPEARMIVVQPWDRSILGAVERALQQGNLGTNPVNDGVVLRINLPSMTEERRVQLTKVVHQEAEEARIAVRKVRQSAQDTIREEKDEDVRATLTEQLQKAVDAANTSIGELAKKKEEEMMTV